MKLSVVSCQWSVGLLLAGVVSGAEPLPLSEEYWKDESFRKSFNGSYRIEARIEPVVSSEVRGLLVEVQELMEDGKREEALEKVKASKLTADSAALQFNLGNLSFEEGKLEEAGEAYAKAIGKYPSFRRAHRNLAMVLVRQEEMEKALEHLIEAMRLGDSDGSTYGLLGFCRLQKGEWASALQAYRMAQLTQPDTAEWKAGMAQCLQNLNAKDEAAAILDEVIRQRPGESSYAMLQASILMELGRSEEAVRALELPRRLSTLDPDGLLLLADLHLRAARVKEAGRVVDEAYAGEEKPGVDRALSVVASAMAVSEWQLAEAVIGKAKEAGETGRRLRLVEARWKILSGEAPEEGAGELGALLKEDPTDGGALLALGGFKKERKELEVAELLFERATAVAEVAADAWVELARLRVDEQRYAAALEAVEQALVLRPGGDLERYREALTNLADAAR